IKNIADLKGMKIRCSATNIPFMKSIGVQPIGMPPPDVPTAMERGVVDGYILPPATIRDFGLIEPSKYMIFPGFYEPCQYILVNLDLWKKIPKHLQELLTSQTEKMAHYAIENIANHLKSELEDFKKQGMTFIEFSPAEASKWSKLASDALYGIVMKKAPEESKKIMKMISK
ncbi:MAG: TRAP transporter substrate-binding protein DctP, partial [Deltaproteobacteria bacterium]|nr:TRAP transporter substrate-binding protein DctP [Deltaproteobacteria bacterium]